MMATPSPPSTRGSSSLPAYTRSPGLLTRRSPLSARPLGVDAFRVMESTVRGASPLTSYDSTKPSSWSTRATSTFIFEAGRSTLWWCAVPALRMRVSRSAIGSLVMRSPRTLLDPGHLSDACQLAEADAAHAEFAHVRARTAADAAAVVLLGGEPRRTQRFCDQRFLCHVSSCGRACRSRRATPAPPRRCARW